MRRIVVLAIGITATIAVLATRSVGGAENGGGTVAATGESVHDARGVDDPASVDVVVDKLRPLSPLDYRPVDLVTVDVPQGTAEAVELRRPAAEAVTRMFAAFRSETGHEMESESAFRSFEDQQATYAAIANRLGSQQAEESAARPGYSEHQTGLAIDVGQRDSSCHARDCFAATAAGVWLRGNAWKYGFIIRYPAGQQSVTGYEYEPWHLRFLGTATAKAVHFHATSLEAYFGLPAAPGYAS